MLLGKIRNRKEKQEEKDRTTNNAVRAAAKERIVNNRSGSPIVPKIKEEKRFTQKEWSKFGDHQKDILTNRYAVVITDHETKKEKWTRRAKQVNLKNFDNAMNKFDKGQKKFWSDFDKGFSDAGMKSKSTVFGGSSSDNTGKIFGTTKPSKRKQNQSDNTTAIFGTTKKVKSKRYRI